MHSVATWGVPVLYLHSLFIQMHFTGVLLMIVAHLFFSSTILAAPVEKDQQKTTAHNILFGWWTTVGTAVILTYQCMILCAALNHGKAWKKIAVVFNSTPTMGIKLLDVNNKVNSRNTLAKIVAMLSSSNIYHHISPVSG